jgi:hypothetical protein
MKTYFAVLLSTLLCSTPVQAQSPIPKALANAGVDPLCIRARMARGVAQFAADFGISYDSSAVRWLSSMRVSKVAPAEIRKIFCGELSVGESWAVAIVAWGNPDQKTTTTTATDTTQIWIYSSGRSVTIVNNKVFSFTDSH